MAEQQYQDFLEEYTTLKFQEFSKHLNKVKQDQISQLQKKNPAYQDHKNSLRYWSEYHNEISSIIPIPEGETEIIDILIVGASRSGKSLILKELETQNMTKVDDDFFTLPKIMGNDVKEASIKGFRVNVREISYQFVKSWQTYYGESRVIMFVSDLSDLSSYCITLTQVLNLLSKFNRPVVLILNKSDAVPMDTQTSVNDLLMLTQLKNSFPGLFVLQTCALSGRNIDVLKEWIAGVFNINQMQPSEKKNNNCCFCLR